MAHERFSTDILIIGMGAAGQLASLYAYDANPELNITIVTKALKGKGGCSRMVQGGLNVVLNDADSHEKHLMDTLKGGQYVNNQDLAKTLVEHPKTRRVDELLRNHGEGGILQRGPLEVIVRMTHGEKPAASKLLEEIGAM